MHVLKKPTLFGNWIPKMRTWFSLNPKLSTIFCCCCLFSTFCFKDITKNHGGYSEFRICPNNDVTKRVTQSCLDQYLLATPTGKTRYIHEPRDSMRGTGDITVELVLPPGLTCTQCVIQWIWTAGTISTFQLNKLLLLLLFLFHTMRNHFFT